MQVNLIAMVLVACANSVVYGQEATSDLGKPLSRNYWNGNAQGQLGFSNAGGGLKQDAILVATGKSIPNPNSVLKTVAFLRDEAIAKELRLDDIQCREIKALLDGTSGQPGVFSVEVADGKLLTREEKVALYAVMRNDREAKVREILDPSQIDRLEQVVRHVEISRVGFANAILQGFLGQDAGVQEIEKPALEISFDAVKSELEKSKTAIAKEAQKEVLSLLNEEQRQLIPPLMGKHFELHEKPLQKLRRLSSERVNGIVPNPESVFDSCILLNHQSIVDELKLTKEQLSYVPNLGKPQNSGETSSAEIELRSRFEPSQVGRLKQIVYQLEVTRLGFGSAIADGYLGKAIDISDSQRTAIRKKAKEIESKAKFVLVELEEAARRKLLGNLSMAQRQAVTALLGKPYRPDGKK